MSKVGSQRTRVDADVLGKGAQRAEQVSEQRSSRVSTEPTTRTHTVRPGETAASIAAQYPDLAALRAAPQVLQVYWENAGVLKPGEPIRVSHGKVPLPTPDEALVLDGFLKNEVSGGSRAEGMRAMEALRSFEGNKGAVGMLDAAKPRNAAGMGRARGVEQAPRLGELDAPPLSSIEALLRAILDVLIELFTAGAASTHTFDGALTGEQEAALRRDTTLAAGRHPFLLAALLEQEGGAQKLLDALSKERSPEVARVVVDQIDHTVRVQREQLAALTELVPHPWAMGLAAEYGAEAVQAMTALGRTPKFGELPSHEQGQLLRASHAAEFEGSFTEVLRAAIAAPPSLRQEVLRATPTFDPLAQRRAAAFVEQMQGLALPPPVQVECFRQAGNVGFAGALSGHMLAACGAGAWTTPEQVRLVRMLARANELGADVPRLGALLASPELAGAAQPTRAKVLGAIEKAARAGDTLDAAVKASTAQLDVDPNAMLGITRWSATQVLELTRPMASRNLSIAFTLGGREVVLVGGEASEPNQVSLARLKTDADVRAHLPGVDPVDLLAFLRGLLTSQARDVELVITPGASLARAFPLMDGTDGNALTGMFARRHTPAEARAGLAALAEALGGEHVVDSLALELSGTWSDGSVRMSLHDLRAALADPNPEAAIAARWPHVNPQVLIGLLGDLSLVDETSLAGLSLNAMFYADESGKAPLPLFTPGAAYDPRLFLERAELRKSGDRLRVLARPLGEAAWAFANESTVTAAVGAHDYALSVQQRGVSMGQLARGLAHDLARGKTLGAALSDARNLRREGYRGGVQLATGAGDLASLARLAPDRQRVLLVGVTKFPNAPSLAGPEHDIARLAGALRKQGHPSDRVRTLLNAPEEAVKKAITSLVDTTPPGEAAVVLLSTHGTPDGVSLGAGALSRGEMEQLEARARARGVDLHWIIDACHSGNIAAASRSAAFERAQSALTGMKPHAVAPLLDTAARVDQLRESVVALALDDLPKGELQRMQRAVPSDLRVLGPGDLGALLTHALMTGRDGATFDPRAWLEAVPSRKSALSRLRAKATDRKSPEGRAAARYLAQLEGMMARTVAVHRAMHDLSAANVVPQARAMMESWSSVGGDDANLFPRRIAVLLDQTDDLLNALQAEAEHALQSDPPQLDRARPLVAALESGLQASEREELATLVAFVEEREIPVDTLLNVARAYEGSPRARVWAVALAAVAEDAVRQGHAGADFAADWPQVRQALERGAVNIEFTSQLTSWAQYRSGANVLALREQGLDLLRAYDRGILLHELGHVRQDAARETATHLDFERDGTLTFASYLLRQTGVLSDDPASLNLNAYEALLAGGLEGRELSVPETWAVGQLVVRALGELWYRDPSAICGIPPGVTEQSEVMSWVQRAPGRWEDVYAAHAGKHAEPYRKDGL